MYIHTYNIMYSVPEYSFVENTQSNEKKKDISRGLVRTIS